MKRVLARRRRRISHRRSSHAFLGRTLRGVELCEPRWMLASDVQVINGASGAGTLDAQFIAGGGALSFSATDLGGDTLSSGAMGSIAANVNILVEATQTVDFNLAGTLALATGNGHTVTFSTNTAGGGDIEFLNANDTLSTAGGDIVFSAGDFLTVGNLNSGGGSIQLTTGVTGAFSDSATTSGLTSGGGDITLHADNATINTPVNAGSGIVTIAPVTATQIISLGGADAAGTLGIDDTELGRITASVVRIGGNLQTGAIHVDGNITAHAGYNALDLIATGTGGAIVENFGAIAVANLALQAEAGIGSAAAINLVDPINAAFNNATTGGVSVQSTSALTIAAVDGVNTSANNAGGGVVTLAADGPLSFAVDTSSSGALSAMTSEVGVVPEEDIIVNTAVTVRSSGANVLFSSADNLLLSAGSAVTAPLGKVTLNVAVGDSDDDSIATVAGTVSSSGPVPTLSGGPTFGPTSMVIDYASVANLPQGLDLSAGIAGTPLTITDAGGAARHNYNITDKSITRDGAVPITYNSSNANFTSTTVTGGDASGSAGDTFTVAPSTNVAFTVHGGLPVPSATTGDTLNLSSFVGATLSDTFSATGYSGNWAVTGDQPINFDGIETVDIPADLSVTNTDGKTAAVPGTSDTYTIVVTNAGPSSVTGAAVTDAFPATFTGATYTATATGGATGFTASGGGNISDTVNLPVGGTITYVVAGTVSASATGTLSNTATVTAPVGITNTDAADGSATDSDELTAQADLSITKTDGKTTVVPGTSDTYTVVVANSGPSSVTGASMTDSFPASFTGATFTATATGGATGFTGSGSGNISDTVSLPVGATVTYVVTGMVSASATGSLSNTATLAAPAGVTEINAANNSATDSDTLIAQADLSITKTDGKTTVVAGTSDTYTIFVTNAGPSSVTGASVKDTIPAIFASATFTATATGGATGFTASGSGNISDTVNLPLGSTITYTVSGTVSASASGTLSNTATVTAPAGVTDTKLANNSATDTDTVTPPPLTGFGFLAGVPGDGTAQTFVQNLYRELIGRDADSSGLAYFVTLDSESGHQAVIQAFLNSVEYKAHYVTTVYETYLGRAPDQGGLQFWTGLLGKPGTSGGQNGSADEKFVLAAIVGSDEFFLDAGKTTQGWVSAMYHDLLGRSPEASGLAFWTSLAQGPSANDRDGLVRQFLSSPEAEHLLLDSFYPAPGGTASHLLPAPGTPVAPGSNDLAILTGDGWENLYPEGPSGSSPQANDVYFADLAIGASWDDIQFALLTTGQFYTNANRPLTL